MRPLSYSFAILVCLLFAGLNNANALRITTWNLEWFPNGSPHERSAAIQVKHISAAADVIREINPDILLLQEIKNYATCQRLADAVGPGIYKVAVCSAFKQGRGTGKQQVAILTKENAQAAWAESWVSKETIDPPRGFAFAWFRIAGQDIGIYSVHLKSNLVLQRDKDAEIAVDIQKREIAAVQLVNHMHSVIAKAMPAVTSFIVGGDFNTTADQKEFTAETTQRTLTDDGFRSALENLPQVERVTHPGQGTYPDATFDYLFGKNVVFARPIITKSDVSDHYPVTCNVEVGVVATVKPREDIRVWVNFPTHSYFKPGMMLYGQTASGAYMKESEALASGFRPAGSK